METHNLQELTKARDIRSYVQERLGTDYQQITHQEFVDFLEEVNNLNLIAPDVFEYLRTRTDNLESAYASLKVALIGNLPLATLKIFRALDTDAESTVAEYVQAGFTYEQAMMMPHSKVTVDHAEIQQLIQQFGGDDISNFFFSLGAPSLDLSLYTDFKNATAQFTEAETQVVFNTLKRWETEQYSYANKNRYLQSLVIPEMQDLALEVSSINSSNPPIDEIRAQKDKLLELRHYLQPQDLRQLLELHSCTLNDTLHVPSNFKFKKFDSYVDQLLTFAKTQPETLQELLSPEAEDLCARSFQYSSYANRFRFEMFDTLDIMAQTNLPKDIHQYVFNTLARLQSEMDPKFQESYHIDRPLRTAYCALLSAGQLSPAERNTAEMFLLHDIHAEEHFKIRYSQPTHVPPVSLLDLAPSLENMEDSKAIRFGLFLRSLMKPSEEYPMPILRPYNSQVDYAPEKLNLKRSLCQICFEIAEYNNLSLETATKMASNIIEDMDKFEAQEHPQFTGCDGVRVHYQYLLQLYERFAQEENPRRKTIYADAWQELATKLPSLPFKTLTYLDTTDCTRKQLYSYDKPEPKLTFNQRIALISMATSGQLTDYNAYVDFTKAISASDRYERDHDSILVPAVLKVFSNAKTAMQTKSAAHNWKKQHDHIRAKTQSNLEALPADTKKQVESTEAKIIGQTGADLPDVTPIRAGLANTTIASCLEEMAANVSTRDANGRAVKDALLTIAELYRDAEDLIKKAVAHDEEQTAQNIKKVLEEQINSSDFKEHQIMVMRSENLEGAASYLKSYAARLGTYLKEQDREINTSLQARSTIATQQNFQNTAPGGLFFNPNEAINQVYEQVKEQAFNNEPTPAQLSSVPATYTERVFNEWLATMQQCKEQYYGSLAEAVNPLTSLTPSEIKEELDRQRPKLNTAKQIQEQAINMALRANEKCKQCKDSVDRTEFDTLYQQKVKNNPAMLEFLGMVQQQQIARTTVDQIL